MIGKKGEGMTSGQIITLVLLIAGFLIVLGFLAWLFLINRGTSEDACKVSVLSRASNPVDASKGIIPLKCKTKKICIIESSSETCSQFLGEKDVVYETLKGTFAEKKAQLEKIAADAMYDCWSMMGEGKLDIFGNLVESFGFKSTDSVCVICSRIAVSDEIIKKAYPGKDSIKNVDERSKYDDSTWMGSEEARLLKESDINNYMNTHQVPGSGKTYTETFTDKGAGTGSKVDPNFLKNNDVFNDPRLNSKENIEGVAPPKETAFVFMQIKTQSVESVLKNMAVGGGAIAGGAFRTPILGSIGRRVIMTPVGGTITAIGVAAVAGYGAYNAKQGQLAAAGYCGEFTSSQAEAQKGCSIVQGLEYDYRTINHLCSRIEGSP